MEIGNERGRPLTQTIARARGSFRTLVECHALAVSRKTKERFGLLVEEVARLLREGSRDVWVYEGDAAEVGVLENAFRSKRRRRQFVVRTRCGRTELYVRLALQPRPVPTVEFSGEGQ